jgi:hypothetical protein
MSSVNIIQGIGPDGKRKPLRATAAGELLVDGNAAETDSQLLELRAIRIGLAILLSLDPDDLLKMAAG